MLLLGKQQLSNLLQLANDMLMSKRCFYKSKVCTNKVIAIPELPSHERLLCTDFLIIEQYLHRRQLQAISDNDDAQTPKWHPLPRRKDVPTTLVHPELQRRPNHCSFVDNDVTDQPSDRPYPQSEGLLLHTLA
jgi:hypothetical protein